MRDFLYVFIFLTGFIVGGVCGFPIERKRFGTIWTNEMTRKERNALMKKIGRVNKIK